jgi:lipopolysaccharide/colanic/teichoic acid biosynthesis glycosyltransferase
LLIIITSPIFLIAFIFVFFETGRPLIYKNERVGFKNKLFFVYKIRSMYKDLCVGSEVDKNYLEALKMEEELIKQQNSRTGAIYKIKNDPRVTKVGFYLRKWSVDELPQLINVLKGEMSLVGPRPHQPREVLKYEKEHRKVFSVLPGITGLSQISGRSDLKYEEEEVLDIFYIENWSFFLDLVILIKTPFILFKKRDVV